MKKLISMLMALVCILMWAMNVSAYGEEVVWHCEVCDEDRTTQWCPICGAHMPEKAIQVWVCPVCGKDLSTEYNFCPDDGTSKIISSGAWPVRDMEGVSITLRPAVTKGMQRMAYYGPDSQVYAGAGGYEPGKVTSATALFMEDGYVLVKLVYNHSMQRCVYFKENMLRYENVKSISLKGYKAKTRADIIPRMGPGYDYDEVINKDYIGSRGESKTARVHLEKNVDVEVFFEVDGWVFVEYVSSIGLIRAWVPANQVD